MPPPGQPGGGGATSVRGYWRGFTNLPPKNMVKNKFRLISTGATKQRESFHATILPMVILTPAASSSSLLQTIAPRKRGARSLGKGQILHFHPCSGGGSSSSSSGASFVSFLGVIWHMRGKGRRFRTQEKGVRTDLLDQRESCGNGPYTYTSGGHENQQFIEKEKMFGKHAILPHDCMLEHSNIDEFFFDSCFSTAPPKGF